MMVQPVPIKTIVVNKTAPFILERDLVSNFAMNYSDFDLQVGDVVKNSPGGDVFALDFDKVEIDGVEEQREGLEKDEAGHQVVDLEHRVATLPQDKHPEDAGEQEEDGHHEVQSGQGHLSG